MTIIKFFALMFVGLFIFNCQFIPSFMDNKGVLFKIKVEAKNPDDKEILNQAANIFERRLDAIGVRSEAKVSTDAKAPDEVIVKVFGKPDIELVKKILLFEADLALMAVDSPPNPNLATYPTKEAAEQQLQKFRINERKIIIYSESVNSPKKWIIVKTPPIITGDDLRDAAAVSRTEYPDDYQISFSLKPNGAKAFGDWTGRNIGNYMAVVLNDEAKSVAFIQSQIFDQGQISGQFTRSDAEDLALILKSGHLPAKLTLVEEKTFEGETVK
jgi:preprotein translocase subunit SecD